MPALSYLYQILHTFRHLFSRQLPRTLFCAIILDFIAKLIELQPDGRAMLLMGGVVRAMYRDGATEPRHLAPDRVYPVTFNLANIHHTFRAGNRIRIDITSSNFPRRARNTNSGNPILANDTEADICIATNTVHHAEATPSFVELPMLNR